MNRIRKQSTLCSKTIQRFTNEKRVDETNSVHCLFQNNI